MRIVLQYKQIRGITKEVTAVSQVGRSFPVRKTFPHQEAIAFGV
jgi:hypothetical protein